MRLVRAAALLAVVCGCSDPPPPPIIGDSDGSATHDAYVAPCSVPTPGCACPDAGIQEICGTEYHYAGSYVTCSKQYITCQDDGTWSACVGATVYGATD
jgi:hypothetical protein